MFNERTNNPPSKNPGSRSLTYRKYASGVLKEMVYGNTQIINFFNELQQHVDEYSEERKEEMMREVQEHVNAIGLNVAHKNELEKKLKTLGIELTDPVPYQLVLGRFKTANGKINRFTIYQRINDCRITKGLLAEGGLEKLREECEEAVRVNASTDIQIAETEKLIKADERKKRFAFTIKRKQLLIDEIEDGMEKLTGLRSYKKDVVQMRKTIEVLENMTPEQRELVLDYISTSERLFTLVRKIDHLNSRMTDIRLGRDESIVPGAFRRMITKKGMTREDVIEVFNTMKRIANKSTRDEYNLRQSTTKDGEIEKYREVAEKFFTYVFEPDKPIEDQRFLEFFGPREKKEKEEPEGTEPAS